MSTQYSPSVCRTCLASDVRLLPLFRDQHLDIIKKLTKIRFNIEGRPRVLCEDCFGKLQICSEFCDLANRSESIFKELLSKGIETTPENIAKVNQSMIQPTSVSPIRSTTIDTNNEGWSTTEKVLVEVVKEEPGSETEDSLSENEDDITMKYKISVKEDKISVKKDEISLKLERTAAANLTDDKPYACNICDKRFSWKSYVVNHMRIHSGERPFACNICDKNFIDRYRLMAHMRIHTEKNPFACNMCDKEFTQSSGLERHMRTHTREKPYACTECDERFTQKSSLIDHERIHTGEKPYPCNRCDKHFAKKSTLVRHMRTHTGEKPFVCNKCEKQYTRKSILEKHMRKCKVKSTHYVND